jgi:hypothetical protein
MKVDFSRKQHFRVVRTNEGLARIDEGAPKDSFAGLR